MKRSWLAFFFDMAVALCALALLCLLYAGRI